MKKGQKVYTVGISDKLGLFVHPQGEIVTIHTGEVWTPNATLYKSRFFGHPEASKLPQAVVQRIPNPFMYCLEHEIEPTKKAVIAVYNECQRLRKQELEALLLTCNEIPTGEPKDSEWTYERHMEDLANTHHSALECSGDGPV